MKKLINKDLGNEMYVADDRLEEYLRAGHSLAEEAPEEAPAKPKSRKSK